MHESKLIIGDSRCFNSLLWGMESKNVIVTGASRGIGADTVLKLLADGCRVMAISRSSSGLDTLFHRAQVAGIDSNLIAVVADITIEEGRQFVLRRCRELFVRLDILVNNAGSLLNKDFANITEAELTGVYKVNVFAPFLLTQLLLPELKKSGSSHVVNIGSMGGVNGSVKFPGLSAYSSSKGALSVLSELLAVELADSAIKVNCLALGAAGTEMLKEAFPEYKAPVTSEEMARWIAWFSVNWGCFFNGKVLPVAVSTP